MSVFSIVLIFGVLTLLILGFSEYAFVHVMMLKFREMNNSK